MNYLIIAIAAYLLNAVAVTIDKILLVKRLPNPALYVFYISAFSLVVLAAAPFTKFPPFNVFFISSAATILWTLGAFFMFRALKTGEAIRVIPVIGTLIPIILLFMSAVSGSINLNEIWAVIFLLLGLIFLVFPYLKGKFSFEEIGQEVISALFFANSYFLLKIAYDAHDFQSVFVYSRLILLPIILIILAFPFLRRLILSGASHKPGNLFSKTGFMLLVGQGSGGLSQLLLTFAISLANPAVINSIQGIQYVFLFILGLLLSKKYPAAFNDKLNRAHILGKVVGIVLIFFGLWVLSFGTTSESKPQLGITFSAKYARELGLDSNEVFGKILTDLKPEIIRLPVYWDEVEKTPNQFDFSESLWLVQQAQKYNREVILVVGFKQPRWPECFQPEWTKSLNREQFNSELNELVKTEVETFKKFPNIKYWQVENEPFVEFGICPKPNKELLLQEIKTVKDLDSRPVIITDSGELSNWIEAMKTSDIFASTLYRAVWNPFFGTVSYPWPPIFYRIKANIVQFLTNTTNEPIMISELQAEPWIDDGQNIKSTPVSKQMELFPVKQLAKNTQFAQETRLGPVLFWGAEWWYYMKLQGISDYWRNAKIIFAD